MLRPEYPIKTERLVLRPYREDDFDDAFAFMSDPDVVRYLYWEVRDADGVREFLRKRMTETELTEPGNGLVLAAEWPEAGHVVGEVVLRWLSAEHRQGEVGFVLNPSYQGKGLAREAAEAALRLGFEDLGLHRIIGRCDALNTPSAKLMERLGMRLEAHHIHDEIFKGQWGDVLVYAMLEDEWRSHREATISPE